MNLFILLQTANQQFMTVKRLLLIICFSSGLLYGQVVDSDSLKLQLLTAEGMQRLDLLEQLSLFYANNHLPDSALRYDSIALKISKETKDLYAQSNVLNNMGLSFYSKAEYATAIRLFQESLELKESISDTVAIVKSLNNLGVLYQLVGDYDQSISMLMRSLEIRKKQGDTLGIARTLNNISVIYKNIGKTDMSLTMLDEALEIYVHLQNSEGLASVFNNMGTIYQLENQHDKAKESFLKSLTYKQGSNDHRSIANTYNNLGMIYFAIGDTAGALDYYRKAYTLRQGVNDRFGLASVTLNLGKLFVKMGDFEKAENYLHQSLQIVKDEGFKNLLQRVYSELAVLYGTSRQFERAYHYATLASQTKDSVYTDQLNTRITELEERQKNERTYRENELLRVDNELKTLKMRRNRIWLLVSLSFLGLVVALGILSWFRLVEKRKLTLSLEKNMRLLKESEIKYKSVVEQTEEVIFIHWGGVILFANAHLFKISGLTQNELYRKKPDELIYLPDRVAFLDFISNNNETLSTERKKEFRLITKNGKLKWLDMTQTMISLNNEKAYLVMARDITERKETSEFIRKLEQAVRQSPASIIITDSKGHIEYVNHKFTDMSGYELDEVKGKNPRILKSGKMEPEVYTSMWETITQGQVWRGELLNRSRNGSLYWESASISPIFDENQIITHFLAVKEDITQRKADEERLRKSETSLREANATKDKFFSIIAHDLKNPFNVILGFSNLLLNEYDDFDEQEKKEFIANIHEASASSFRLLQNLLDWSRTQTGTIKYYPEIVDVKLAVDEIFTLNNSVARNKEINMQTEFSGNMKVLADHNMLLTILRNLVSNALKFTPRGGKVAIKCFQLDDCLQVAVSDNGIGIPEKQLGHLFKIDEQVQRSGTESERGTGLGLILCNEFVKKNGGKMWVESEEGKGSTFYFTLNYS